MRSVGDVDSNNGVYDSYGFALRDIIIHLQMLLKLIIMVKCIHISIISGIPTAIIYSPQDLVKTNAFDVESNGIVNGSTYGVLNSYGIL